MPIPSHIIQETCRQLHKIWALTALPIKLSNVKVKVKSSQVAAINDDTPLWLAGIVLRQIRKKR